MIPINTQRRILAAAIFFAATCLFFSCKKTNCINSGGERLVDLSKKVTSSVNGFVTNEADDAVNGATVQFGASSTITDKYGYFEFNNVQVVKEAAVVTINQTGYFKAIKTFAASEGHGKFFRIKLLPKINQGSFDAAAGGTVTLTNGLSIIFPTNAVITASSGAAYTGQVSVAAQWLNPVADDINSIMPGDLRGIDSRGYIKLLTTYGMSATELTSTNGELLQIAPGKKATITFPLPSAISPSAPATIPLWYFNENNGLWKEEGTAIKSGNNYIGEVSHFSFWNCDLPGNWVNFACNVVDSTGRPFQNAVVMISYANFPGTGPYDFTDSYGFAEGAIPGDAQLILQVFRNDDGNCRMPTYSQNFSTTSADVNRGNIMISTAGLATVSGNVNNCNGTALTNGYVIMRRNGINYHYPVNTGAFNFNFLLCDNNDPVTLIAEDILNHQASNAISVTLIPGANAAGTLTACGNVTDEYIHYSLNGTAYHIATPSGVLTEGETIQNNPVTIYVSGLDGSSADPRSATFSFDQPGIAVGSSQPLRTFYAQQITDSFTIVTNTIPVHIIEYGAAGQYIAGNFSGTITGAPPANRPYAITCNFRVRRN